MAIYYANAISGSSGNNGTSAATPKATLAQCNTLASAGDTIICTGVFKEALPNSKQLFWVGYGYCEFNGNGGVGSNHSYAANTSYRNITFTNWSSAPIGASAGAAVAVQAYNCVFRDMANAVFMANTSAAFTAINCFFHDLSSRAVELSQNSIYANIPGVVLTRCVFYGNSIDLKLTGVNGSATSAYFNYCCFGSSIQIQNVGATNMVHPTCDWNVFDFTNGKSQFNSVDKTTIAAWRTSTSAEANSIDRVWRADVGDYANRALFSSPAGYLLTAGPNAMPLGVQRAALCISNNTNSSMWTGGVFSNTQINGGNIELSAGQTVGTAATDVIDLGASVAIARICPTFTGLNYPTAYLDTDTGDSPNYFNLEYRVSASSFLKTDVSPSWVTAPINRELAATGRYLQIRVTLRG